MKNISKRTSQHSKGMTQEAGKKKAKKPRSKHQDKLDKAVELFTRSLEVLAVLFSMFWGIEAFATQSNAACDLAKSPQGAGRSLSSLAVPIKKSSATVEFLQYSRLNEAFQTRFQTLHLPPSPENPALSFKQSPFFAHSQFEVVRFPTFLKK